MANVSRVSCWKWDQKKADVAILLAQGYLIKEAAEAVGVSIKSISRWKQDTNFTVEIDRLSVMIGVASRAERLRIAQRVVRQKVTDEKVETEKDLLDWIKLAQSETDGIKLDFTALIQNAASMADSGPGGIHTEQAIAKPKSAKSAARTAKTSKTS